MFDYVVSVVFRYANASNVTWLQHFHLPWDSSVSGLLVAKLAGQEEGLNASRTNRFSLISAGLAPPAQFHRVVFVNGSC